MKILADPYNQLPAITFWLLGSLSGIKVSDLQTVAPLVILGLVPLALLRWRIGVLSLGDDEAKALGVNVRVVRGVVIGAATLVTATAVSVSGVIGWIGLVIPHMARLLVGPRYDRVLPASVLMGAAFLVLIDTVARSAARIEIPLGLLTALLGAPVFVWLLARGRRMLELIGAAGLRARRSATARRIVAAGIDLAVRARRSALPARAQRRRQDHAVQDPAGPDPAPRRRGHDRRPADRPAHAPRAGAIAWPMSRRRR